MAYLNWQYIGLKGTLLAPLPDLDVDVLIHTRDRYYVGQLIDDDDGHIFHTTLDNGDSHEIPPEDVKAWAYFDLVGEFTPLEESIPASQEKLTPVILESPYAGDIKGNIAYARRAMRDSLLRGEAPYASHMLYTQDGVLDDNDPPQRKLGMRAGWAWMEKASYIVFYVDYGISKGMKQAMCLAHSRGIHFIFRRIGKTKPMTDGVGGPTCRYWDCGFCYHPIGDGKCKGWEDCVAMKGEQAHES